MGDDRVSVLIEDGDEAAAVVVMDGASSFVPVPIPAGVYVDALGYFIGAYLDPATDLRSVLRQAIEATAKDLDLIPGRSPSSTVTIIRQAGSDVECLTLGDNLVVFPDRQVIDDRMEQFGQEHRSRYQQRLRDGHGWDEAHAQALAQLQAEQIKHRNQPGGYWIAEATPEAADHALVIRKSVEVAPWAVIATDGAYDLMTHLGINDWSKVAIASQDDLKQLLARCQDWEKLQDPNGQRLARAKKHDDKSIATTRFKN
jgi:hypothetical protein